MQKECIGYMFLSNGSNTKGQYLQEMEDFCVANDYVLLETYEDRYRSAVTDNVIDGLQNAVQAVLSAKNRVLLTSTMRNIEVNLAIVAYMIKTQVPMLDTEEPDADIVTNRGLLSRTEKTIRYRIDRHARRVKKGQEHARRYRKKIGSPQILEAAKKGSQSISESAKEFRLKILPIIEEIKNEEEPPVSLETIKRGLEKRNVLTRSGNREWQRSTIRNMLKKGEQ